ncbi:Uma2 family endonuclease [Lederbergia wuyishanensis]|uniref:Uma2 family endonuclease n=1 Tax=Lederbergia wuyishanensis TaxID=1347903 RepID=A0ABU0D3M0_9BACI|nr:Uma2 family endonuclease [Lederbergia wuyishanensis]MCJ8007853.1 Uma2 family endonuclease [Lederbergia wuyishanensis]MDQ0342979.1 Uma2 family endonuclease [Lederbergia wuyishanensis]
MTLYQKNQVTLNEFLQIRENTEELLEYIDGFIYMSPSPSIRHQRISRKLLVQLDRFLEGKPCEVFSAPIDIELKNDEMDGTKIVIPDLSVICDKEGFTDAKYVGVPSLIIEILSPSNQSHDLITKLNIYMTYGVKEYWIVNPILQSITVYTLNDEDMYEQHDMKTEIGQIHSSFLEEFCIELKELFSEK